MKKLIILTIAAALLSSCGRKHEGEQPSGILSHVISITDNEDKGVKDILGFFGGQCRYSVGYRATPSQGKVKYFELELSKCPEVEKMKTDPDLPCSNMAYRFFSHLNADERKNYDEIHSVIIFGDGRKSDIKYSISELALIEQRMHVVQHVCDLIRDRDYAGLSAALNDSNAVSSYNKQELIEGVKKNEAAYGPMTNDFDLWGYHIETADNGAKLLHVSLVMHRGQAGNAFSVYLDLHGSDGQVYGIDYKM